MFINDLKDSWLLIVFLGVIVGNDVYSVFESDGEFWIGIWRGLFREWKGIV